MKLLILIFLKRFQKLILISLHVIYIILSPWIEIRPLSLTSNLPYKYLRNYILPPYPALWFKFRTPPINLRLPLQIMIAQSLTWCRSRFIPSTPSIAWHITLRSEQNKQARRNVPVTIARGRNMQKVSDGESGLRCKKDNGMTHIAGIGLYITMTVLLVQKNNV